jgi:hypothetical protein
MPLAEYLFYRDRCLENNFPPNQFISTNYFQNLSGSGIPAKCILSDGVAASKLQSTGTLAIFQKQVQSNGFKVELWLQPKLNMSSHDPTVGIYAFGLDKVFANSCTNNFLVGFCLL